MRGIWLYLKPFWYCGRIVNCPKRCQNIHLNTIVRLLNDIISSFPVLLTESLFACLTRQNRKKLKIIECEHRTKLPFIYLVWILNRQHFSLCDAAREIFLNQKQNWSDWNRVIFFISITLDPVRKNGYINTTSTIDGRLTAVASTPCMTTINSNSILHQPTQLLSHSKPYQHPHLAAPYDIKSSSMHVAQPNATIGHSNNISGSNCHSSINRTKISSLTMSQLSTVYATKRRRRNGKR